jgi:hypothetical protein
VIERERESFSAKSGKRVKSKICVLANVRVFKLRQIFLIEINLSLISVYWAKSLLK